MHSQKVSKSQGGVINSGEHSFSAQSLIKHHGASWNSPPSHPSLLKIHVGAATRSTSLKALDQFSHILITMSVKGECWEIEYYFRTNYAFLTSYIHARVVVSRVDVVTLQDQILRIARFSCGFFTAMAGNIYKEPGLFYVLLCS